MPDMPMPDLPMMPKPANRFEQVDEPAEDAMTLTLHKEGEKNYGVLQCPAKATGGRLPKDFNSGELPLKESFQSAIRLANEFKVPLVIVDPDRLWQKDWGKLYRWEDEPDADEPDPSLPPAA